ncbi:hypothetical protein LUZ60_002828 [Juncus effusus]|nr:hypothetical protein LUZ60_002828 [Juncus effusus]
MRKTRFSLDGLNKGTWTREEDKILTSYIEKHGPGRWTKVPKKAGLNRCGKSCRLRWLNYLQPDIKRGNITQDEEDLIIRLHNLLGNRWSLIAGRLPGRTDNEIKNYWNTFLKRKANKQGHMAKTDSFVPYKPIRPKVSRNWTAGYNCMDTHTDRKVEALNISDDMLVSSESSLIFHEKFEKFAEWMSGGESWFSLDDFFI